MKNLKNNVINNFKKILDIYLLNYILIIIYFIVFTFSNIKIDMEQFSRTPDFWTYFSTSNEFYKFSETGYSNRAFFIPADEYLQNVCRFVVENGVKIHSCLVQINTSSKYAFFQNRAGLLLHLSF